MQRMCFRCSDGNTAKPGQGRTGAAENRVLKKISERHHSYQKVQCAFILLIPIPKKTGTDYTGYF